MHLHSDDFIMSVFLYTASASLPFLLLSTLLLPSVIQEGPTKPSSYTPAITPFITENSIPASTCQ